MNRSPEPFFAIEPLLRKRTLLSSVPVTCRMLLLGLRTYHHCQALRLRVFFGRCLDFFVRPTVYFGSRHINISIYTRLRYSRAIKQMDK